MTIQEGRIIQNSGRFRDPESRGVIRDCAHLTRLSESRAEDGLESGGELPIAAGLEQEPGEIGMELNKNLVLFAVAGARMERFLVSDTRFGGTEYDK